MDNTIPITTSLDEARWNAMASKRLDGMDPFVIAVRTTGIYCRVGCPARTPHRQNVMFMDSIGQARAAGYHACKRCRPDAGDLSPWQPRRARSNPVTTPDRSPHD